MLIEPTVGVDSSIKESNPFKMLQNQAIDRYRSNNTNNNNNDNDNDNDNDNRKRLISLRKEVELKETVLYRLKEYLATLHNGFQVSG